MAKEFPMDFRKKPCGESYKRGYDYKSIRAKAYREANGFVMKKGDERSLYPYTEALAGKEAVKNWSTKKLEPTCQLTDEAYSTEKSRSKAGPSKVSTPKKVTPKKSSPKPKIMQKRKEEEKRPAVRGSSSQPLVVPTGDNLMELLKNQDKTYVLNWMKENMTLEQLRVCAEAPEESGPSPRREKAAVQIQKVVRGRQARRQVEEKKKAGKVLKKAIQERLDKKQREQLSKKLGKRELRTLCDDRKISYSKKDTVDQLFEKCVRKENQKMYKRKESDGKVRYRMRK